MQTRARVQVEIHLQVGQLRFLSRPQQLVVQPQGVEEALFLLVNAQLQPEDGSEGGSYDDEGYDFHTEEPAVPLNR
ncbi:hypothetical protein [Hymenobacter terricola]|uniref:hypothetical protein n=1 Tax=Hymenobacter terricola TaxID=2819236 RepID=UPI001B3006DE|nr:hypothetical protein [Hymenobacter terricola]